MLIDEKQSVQLIGKDIKYLPCYVYG